MDAQNDAVTPKKRGKLFYILVGLGVLAVLGALFGKPKPAEKVAATNGATAAPAPATPTAAPKADAPAAAPAPTPAPAPKADDPGPASAWRTFTASETA